MSTTRPEDTRQLRFARRMQSLKPSAIREILKTTESPGVISFAGGLPAPELFPVEAVQEAAARVLAGDAQRALQYGVTEGYQPLRSWLGAHLEETVGLKVPASSVLVTQGSQQGLDLLGKVLINPGDTVLVENPAYLGALQAFQSYEANVVGLPSDAEGVSPEALEEHLRSGAPAPKFLYLIPNYQNPTGNSMSASRRRRIAEVAGCHGLLVVEDDPYGRLRFEGEALPALGASGGEVAWVYLGSISKVVAPGLRVGWLATSDRGLLERLVTAKQATDLQTGSLTQRIVHELLQKPGWLAGHIAGLNSVYRERRDVMLGALQNELAGRATWTRPAGGLFLWVELAGETDTIELLRGAGQHKVAFVPGAPFWVGAAPCNTLRLNFSNATTEQIATGIARLGQLIRETARA